MSNNYSLFWPNDDGYITQYFGTKADIYGKKGHTGLDLRAKGDPSLFAAEKGKVVVAVTGGVDWCVWTKKGWVNGKNYGKGSSFGNYVVIDHGGYFTLYGHMAEVKVKLGDQVARGQVIGVPGNTGLSKGVHCHFELREGANNINNAINPLPYMNHVIKKEDPDLASEWAKSAQDFVKSTGISDGKRPRDVVTREEMWTMLDRFYKLIKQ